MSPAPKNSSAFGVCGGDLRHHLGGGIRQLHGYIHPEPLPDPYVRDLHKLGFNHVCFAVDNIEAEVAKLTERGFKTRSEIMDFHSRSLVFIEGPEGVTIELAQWV
ncbi:MAG: VOC family protein [Methylocystis sp.]|uniref:VOC family protein n=1 Tax=Methylocystis sp. TaxID=1911079 RepID=UPI003DA64609